MENIQPFLFLFLMLVVFVPLLIWAFLEKYGFNEKLKPEKKTEKSIYCPHCHKEVPIKNFCVLCGKEIPLAIKKKNWLMKLFE